MLKDFVYFFAADKDIEGNCCGTVKSGQCPTTEAEAGSASSSAAAAGWRSSPSSSPSSSPDSVSERAHFYASKMPFTFGVI